MVGEFLIKFVTKKQFFKFTGVACQKINLFLQFMGESILMVLMATLLAFLLVWIALPQFNEIAGKGAHM